MPFSPAGLAPSDASCAARYSSVELAAARTDAAAFQQVATKEIGRAPYPAAE